MDTKTIRDRDNREIQLRSDDLFRYVDAFYQGNKIGSFEFMLQDDENGERLLVESMFLEDIEGFKRKRIGTQIVKWVMDMTNIDVIFGEETGTGSGHSSRLVGDGANFSRHIQSEKECWK